MIAAKPNARVPLGPRSHLALALETARFRMMAFLVAARRLGWISRSHGGEHWPWPSFSSALGALRGELPPSEEVEPPTREQVVESLRGHVAEAEERVKATLAAGRRLPLVELSQAFALEPYELEMLVLGLAAELDPGFRAGLQLWRREGDAAALDVDTALLLLGNEPGPSELSFRRAFEPRRPLVASRLVELGPRPDGHRTLFRVADSVVRFALGDPAVGADVQQIARYHPAPVDPLRGAAPPRAVHAAVHRLQHACRPSDDERPAAFHLLGPDGSARRSAVQTAVARSGRPLLSLHAALLASTGEQCGDLLRRVRRDAILTGAVVHIHVAERDETVRMEDTLFPDPPPPPRLPPEPADRNDRASAAPASAEFSHALVALQHHLAHAPPLVVVTAPLGTKLFAGTRRLLGSAVQPLTRVESARVIEAVVGRAAPEQQAMLSEIVESFSLTPGDLAIASRAALLDAQVHGSGSGDSDMLADALVKACQHRAHAQLTSFSERIQTSAGWADVVLSDAVRDRLRELTSFASNYSKVFYEWGFDASMPSGRALTALFAGPSGTGKTLVAGVIARELSRPLYRVDLSRVVSKFIGETERQLGRVFDEAERERAMLLFDEADSIFSRRTDVQSSNDRYANATVNYLLQRLDSFEGFAILTTNRKAAIDSALRRRIKVHVEFELPDASARELLWESHIPRRAPIDGDLDLYALATAAELSGANIRNAVLRACLAAANEGRGLSHALLHSAVERECEDLGRLMRTD